MGIFFSGDELIQIALGIERNGYAFYTTIADHCKDDSCKSVYRFLAGEEKRHEALFSRFQASGAFQPVESYEGEYDTYLKNLVDSLVFRNLEAAQAAGRRMNEADAIATGIQAEKDSILFYVSIQPMVRDADKPLVGTIITEEKGHLRQLIALKESIARNKK